MLTDREKMVLHFCCTITISKLTGIPHRDVVVENIIEDIRKNRCRSLSNGEISSLLEDINEEMFAGSNMFRYLIGEKQDESKHLTDEEIWSRTGEWPNKKMDQSHHSFDDCSCGIPDFPSTLKEQAKMALEMREQGIKDGTRTEGCPVWDELSKNLWVRILNGELDEMEADKESQRVMSHCETCRHPMCVKALFGDVEPKVVGEK